MGVVTYKPVADEAEEGFSQPSSQRPRESQCQFSEILRTLRGKNHTFSDLSVGDLEQIRAKVLRKLLAEELSEKLDQCSHFQLAERAPLKIAIRKILKGLDRTILERLTAAERDGPDVKSEIADRTSLSHLSKGPSRESKQCSHNPVEEFCRSSNDILRVGKRMPDTVTGWDSLPNTIHENILQRVDFQDWFCFKGVSKDWRKFIEGDAFRESRGAKSEGSFTAIHYYIKNQSWRCSGYDLHSKLWKALPPFSYLPLPDAELFSVCGHGALMCADVSKLRKGELVVFNPLTGKIKALPPLQYPRDPVLTHISVVSAQKSYKVIVSGSTTSSQKWGEPNCKIMEVFNSSTSKWKETCNIPGPSFGLSKHQTGVSLNGILFFISALDEYRHRRGDYVLAWDMENWRYLDNWACPIPFVPDSKSLLQLVENNGKVYLFSESKEDVQEPGIVWHRIDEMEFHDRNTGAMACKWTNVVEVRKTGVQEICMYPDFPRGATDSMCVGFGKGKLCIFNTLDRDGVVYDILDRTQCGVLGPPPAHQTGDKVFSLNPAWFTLHPSFACDP